jgi:hypothetical protein
VFNLYSLPFCSISNCIVLLTRWDALVGQTFVKSVKLTVTVVIGIALLIFSAFAIFIVVFFSPIVVSTLEPLPSNGTIVTQRPPSSICGLVVANWSLIEYAGMAAAAQSVAYPPVYEAILGKVLAVGDWTARPRLDNAELPLLLVNRTGSRAVVGFQGVAAPYHVGVVLESVLCYWYPVLMGAIVPFFAIVNQFFLAPILNAYSMQLSNHALGLVPVSTDFLERARVSVESIKSIDPLVFAGHMSGGIVSKALATDQGSYAVAFESPAYRYSYIAASTKDNSTSAEYETVNVYSETSLFSVLEPSITLNVRLPQEQSIFNPANPYETLCLIAAGCATDDQFEALCEQLIGRETFREFFDRWLRPRVPDHS